LNVYPLTTILVATRSDSRKRSSSSSILVHTFRDLKFWCYPQPWQWLAASGAKRKHGYWNMWLRMGRSSAWASKSRHNSVSQRR